MRVRDLYGVLNELNRRLTAFRGDHPAAVRRILAGLAVTASLVVAGSAWFVADLRRDLPDAEALQRIGEMDQATAVFDAADKLAFTIFKEQRIDVSLDAVSPHAISAIVSIEDQRFYDHGGFDWIRIGSAFLANVRQLRAAQGASTITQQLARMSFLTPDKTLRRKLQELMLARRLERLYSKRDILALYMNKAYFGDGLYGIEAAARGYFGKHAKDLSLAEAALLAGLVKSPSTFAPTIRLDRAVARRNVVLRAMRDTGAIDEAAWRSAQQSPVQLGDILRAEEPSGLYFKEQVRQELVDRFGWQRVYQGGLRVFSTIDMAMQRAAEEAVANGLKSLESRRLARTRGQSPANAPPLQAALVAIDPATGYVRAMVGGRDFDESHFNRALQARRQPGSAFKPFVYAAALETGYTPATLIQNLNEPIATLQGAWTPDDEHASDQPISMRAALKTSSNRAAVRLLQDVGIPRAVQYAKKMGVGDVPAVPSLALGSGEVTLQALTAAYAAFANQGDVPVPLLIRRVEDRNGQVLFAAEPQTSHAISATTAYLMADMLADVIDGGTGAGVRSFGFTLPAAGKTGTTNDFHDAWFVGFTPSLVAGAWVGFDEPQTILNNGFAAGVAVPVWASFMKAATKGARPEWLRPPEGIVTAAVCRLSGKLAGEGCGHAEIPAGAPPLVYTEYFARGTEPLEHCDLHASSRAAGSLVAVLHGDAAPIPAAAPDSTLRTIGTVMTVAAPPAESAAAAPPAPEKKRGFWSRLFGRGKDTRATRSDRER
jgi:penicillin-binding protein 1A